jgi:membrane-anchored protein YejM (alkaline phosphatase superfamily)
MNRRRFALSWARKMFFGLGWPLFSLIGLGYLASQHIPDSPLGIFYYVVSFIGHYGALTSLIYFLLFAPLVWLFPSYYFSRIWSLILLLLTSSFLVMDAYLFTKYRLHISPFVFNLLQEGEGQKVFDLNQMMVLVAGALLLVLLVFIWIRGESLWRLMQRRFSNPVKNWYLVIIALCFIVSHSLHIYGDATGKLAITQWAQLFPLHYPATARAALKELGFDVSPSETNPLMTGKLHYPKGRMNCSGVSRKNFLFFVTDQWRIDGFPEEVTPSIAHYQEHGISFENHHAVSTDSQDAMFSLLYALPGNYRRVADQEKKTSVFMEELLRREYEFVTPDWASWLELYSTKEVKSPFFGIINVVLSDKNSITAFDELVRNAIEELEIKNLLKDTIVVITSHKGHHSENMRVPLLILWKGKDEVNYKHFTSQYDTIPTLMSEVWRCENSLRNYSYGNSLFSSESRDFHLMTTEEAFAVVDPSSDRTYKIIPGYNYEVTSNPKPEFILNILKEITRFYKR